MKIKLFFLTLCFSALFITDNLFAQGFYIGGSVGNSFRDKSIEDLGGNDFKVDKNTVGYKVFAGFGSGFLGLEGGYRDLGKVEGKQNAVNFETKSTGWDIAARGKLSLGPVLAFGKAGVFFGNYENTVHSAIPVSNTETTSTFMWGLGAGVKLGLIGIRLEYESLDLSEDNKLSMLSLGGTIHLGAK
ncbi:outer membrane beta-barrel protein [Flexithrix dorotheae]|uniref:outer membrane beta-barrel protein n=1 Tax=Flexithrix dorotheae TaxID=70993 RepID=UPI0003822029|nr:outer membrane beta-barrel protein [Flexithrix dorotheae]